MNRQALMSLGLLVSGIFAAVPGCGEETSNGNGNRNDAGETSSAGKDAGAGDNSGGSVVKPVAGAGGEGGVVQVPGGAGGAPTGGVSAAGAGAGGVAPDSGGAGGAGGENGTVPPGCDVPRSFGKLGSLEGAAYEFGEDLPGAGWEGVLPVKPDGETVLHVDLYDEYGPFVPVRKPLTNYVLQGDDLNNGTCGVCIYIRQLHGLTEKRYFVTGGTVTVTGTGVDGRVTGNASNLTFEEVTLDNNLYSVPVADGCKSRINGVSFDASTATGGAGGAGN